MPRFFCTLFETKAVFYGAGALSVQTVDFAIVTLTEFFQLITEISIGGSGGAL